MFKIKKIVPLLLAAALTAGLAACGEKNTGPEPITENSTVQNSEGSDPSYTCNIAVSALPTDWNPHGEASTESELIRSLCFPGLVDTVPSEDGKGFEWIYEMAESVTDVSADYIGKYGIKTGDEGRVYRIVLNSACRWEDGTEINASSYINSMQQLLNPEMQNVGAERYCSGSDAPIWNAKKYVMGQQEGKLENTMGEHYTMAELIKDSDGIYTTPEGRQVFLAANYPLDDWLEGHSLKEYVDAYGDTYFGMDNWDALLALADENGLVPLTEESYDMLSSVTTAKASWGEKEADLPCYFVYDHLFEAIPWSKVGLWQEDDYTLIYLTEEPVSMFSMLNSLRTSWLVYQPLYDQGKTGAAPSVTTDYCTTVSATPSCGPYKLSSFDPQKGCSLERNENWYGWTDGKHEGQYAATDIVCTLTDGEKALSLFEEGRLDTLSLNSTQLDALRNSPYLLKADTLYTFRYIFVSDLKALKALEKEAGDGSNKRILIYDDFRRAISLAIDRERLCTEASPAYRPAVTLLGNLYYYDIENDSRSKYRQSTAAMESLASLYGVQYSETPGDLQTACESLSGLDTEKARQLLQSVYEQAIADRNYTEGQEIHINCMCSQKDSLSENDKKQQELLNEMIGKAAVGTGFEGKISFTFLCGSDTMYEDVAAGRIEMIRGAWGGSVYHPFSTVRVYSSPAYLHGLSAIHESCGWNPSKERLTVTADFDADGTAEEKTDTFEHFADGINSKEKYADNKALCLDICTQLEAGILNACRCIPWGTEVTGQLCSPKIAMASEDYDVMYGFGGLRLVTFNYSDDEWNAFIEEKGGITLH